MMSKKVLAAEIDTAELTLRIAEACIAFKRPPGISAKEALAQLHEAQPDVMAGFNRAAIRAAEYIIECINKSGHYAEMQ